MVDVSVASVTVPLASWRRTRRRWFPRRPCRHRRRAPSPDRVVPGSRPRSRRSRRSQRRPRRVGGRAAAAPESGASAARRDEQQKDTREPHARHVKRYRRVMKLLPWSVLALVFAGCGSSSSTTTADAAAPPADPGRADRQAVQRRGRAFCDALFACCADPQTLARFAVRRRLQDHVRRVLQDDLGDAILPSAKAGATVLDESVAACVASLGGMKAGGAACTRRRSSF